MCNSLMVRQLPMAAIALALAANASVAEPSRQRSFEQALESAFPMTPEMLRSYLLAFEENARAMRSLPEPDAITDEVRIDLEPGSPPPAISLAPGIATLIQFTDSTGAPLPVRRYVLGDGNNFEIAHLGPNSHAITVSPLVRAGWSNLVIALGGMPNPVVMRLRIDPGRAHFRRSVQIAASGGHDLSSPVRDAVAAGEDLLFATLSGSGLPSHARQVPVAGANVDAWQVGDELFLRSRHPLLSPGWRAAMSGPSGFHAYRLPVSATLLLSVDEEIALAHLDLP